jgi:ATP-dependent DNA helicase RecG
MPDLNTNVRYLKGIGEQRAKSLEKLGISTMRDLICHFPRAYEDRSVVTRISDAPDDRDVCILAMVTQTPRQQFVRRGMELVKLRAVDDSGSVDITFFNQTYVKNQLVEGESYYFWGRVTRQGSKIFMTNPLFEPEDSAGTVTGRIVPVYPLTAGVSQKMLISAIRTVLDNFIGELPNALPDAIRWEYGLASNEFAYENIHFPKSVGELELARKRLIFEELFVLSAALQRMKGENVKSSGRQLEYRDPQELFLTLPFSPTGAQERAIGDAFSDMTSGKAMNRLVQGDVGSGKTLVAAACAWLCYMNGAQTAFMAPTEILAEQHFATMCNFLSPLGVRIDLLTGSMTASAKRAAIGRLALGETDLIIGTHALLTDNVEFSNLALVITDEQHRFGVEQRSALSEKAHTRPHVLVMSATPIPRTLALMMYGDLDISVINELPPGRQKVDTFLVGEDYRQRINNFIRKLVGEGRQVFIVCPMVEENDELPSELKSATEYAKELSETTFPDLRIACIHGKMKGKEKERIMQQIVAGEVDILVSTTVIEVGVDVPNAALMIVENADRFGLSQLHQLRGRVGRGEHKSYCILVSDNKSEETQRRLKIMCKTNDGFKISEEDLALRGPGDFFGSRQHGLPEMHIADLCSDMETLNLAQDAAKAVLKQDPRLSKPENQCLANRIDELFLLNENAMN